MGDGGPGTSHERVHRLVDDRRLAGHRLAPLVEPVWWLLRNRRLAQPVWIWTAEVIVGLLLLGLMARTRVQQGTRPAATA